MQEFGPLDDSDPTLVGGVDISFVKGSDTDACACLVVLDAESGAVVYERTKLVVGSAFKGES